MMKNNKGLTLVELVVTLAVMAIVLVEIGMLMSNCSRFYRSSAMEIDLQAEATQVIQQIEDMLVDAQVSINHTYNPALGSDSQIKIVTNETINGVSGNEVTYELNYVRLNPSVSYGNLYLVKTDSTGTVGLDAPATEPSAPYDLLLAEFVGSVALDMSNYYSGDIITLNITMDNGRTTYSASKDIFNRNLLGTKRNGIGGGTPASVESTAVQALRFGTLDLRMACDKGIREFLARPENAGKTFTYDYEWVDATGSNGLQPQALYSKSGSKLSCKAEINDNPQLAYPRGNDPQCKIVCYAVDTSSGARAKAAEIEIGTNAVEVGLGTNFITQTSKRGYGLVFPSANNSSKYIYPVKLKGFDPAYCSKIDYAFSLQHFNSSIDLDTLDSMDPAAIDLILASCISYDGSWNGEFKTGTYNTGVNGSSVVGFDSGYVTGNIDWSHVTVPGGGYAGELPGGSALNASKINNLGFKSDQAGNSLLVQTDRMCDGNVNSYYNQIRKGYILKGHFKMTFVTGHVVDYDLFFFPNAADDAAVNGTYLENTLKIFYAMIDKIPEPATP